MAAFNSISIYVSLVGGKRRCAQNDMTLSFLELKAAMWSDFDTFSTSICSFFCTMRVSFRGFGQKETSLFPLCARGFVPRPILTVAWLGLEDKNIFQLKYVCVFRSLFWSVSRPERQELTKTTRRKRMKFCIKKNVCLPEPATWPWVWVLELAVVRTAKIH